MPEAGVSAGSLRRTLGSSMRPWVRDRQVFCVNRRPGLQRGMTMAALGAEHAQALRDGFDEPVDVLGASTGGSIAQQLGAEHPDVVRRLVLVSTGCRLGPYAKLVQRQIAARVRAGATRQTAVVMASGCPASASIAGGMPRMVTRGALILRERLAGHGHHDRGRRRV